LYDGIWGNAHTYQEQLQNNTTISELDLEDFQKKMMRDHLKALVGPRSDSKNNLKLLFLSLNKGTWNFKRSKRQKCEFFGVHNKRGDGQPVIAERPDTPVLQL
jgi:hypothetical protein